ncbi:enoyl-CoA hydratase/isomerase family protein [Conexibacter woesei]|uniref:enoyl-CoA hydratase n=1 Tax=Conexibacter woesei (strain DSM 14684 / CCUG 47730 / CIP 108061 / JCM 11494 / NBRC 100937 / ID131577) TaxID=469383 RepID=D3F5C0_CONWI|nr:enoyl-CoA hydratase-related protein [Conexibacter woesei]ADB50587.1 Enoyl-CoA hydratase/isomerase [Conexibacter woesei DSM 14684]
MAGDPLVLTDVRDGVALARMNRAGERNVLSPELRDALAGALEQADADPAVRCHVVAGGDEVFAAGADIATMAVQDFQDAMRAEGARLWPRLRAIRKPVVAAVSGYALGGGCELALAADLVVASETAVFSQPEVGLGIVPGGGGTQRLARLLGRQRAMELVLTGRRLTAHEARELGIVNVVAPAGGWLDAAHELAAKVARRSGFATELAKRAVLAAEETTLTAGLATERDLFALAMAGDDRVEGMTAFLERRRPVFRGR